MGQAASQSQCLAIRAAYCSRGSGQREELREPPTLQLLGTCQPRLLPQAARFHFLAPFVIAQGGAGANRVLLNATDLPSRLISQALLSLPGRAPRYLQGALSAPSQHTACTPGLPQEVRVQAGTGSGAMTSSVPSGPGQPWSY